MPVGCARARVREAERARAKGRRIRAIKRVGFPTPGQGVACLCSVHGFGLASLAELGNASLSDSSARTQDAMEEIDAFSKARFWRKSAHVEIVWDMYERYTFERGGGAQRLPTDHGPEL